MINISPKKNSVETCIRDEIRNHQNNLYSKVPPKLLYHSSR